MPALLPCRVLQILFLVKNKSLINNAIKTDFFLHAIKRSTLLLYFLVASLVARSDSKKHAGGTPSKRFKTMLSNDLFGTVLNALISLKTKIFQNSKDFD